MSAPGHQAHTHTMAMALAQNRARVQGAVHQRPGNRARNKAPPPTSRTAHQGNLCKRTDPNAHAH
eukprot:12754330-Alexandrium_andersonii.AAC.1